MESRTAPAKLMPRRRSVNWSRWNEFEGPFFTIRMGGGLLYDASAFSQDDDSTEQLQLDADHNVRDGRLLLK